MPSNLSAKARKRYFGATVGRLTSNRSSTITDLIAPTLHVVGPPWGGFAPDLALGLTTFSDAIDCTNLVSKNGVLQPDDGFEMIDIARIPLGGPTMSGSPTLSFAEANPDTITRSAGSWTTDGFVAGDSIQIDDGTATVEFENNRGVNTIAAGGVATTVLTLVSGDDLETENTTANLIVTGVTPPATAGQEEAVTGLFQYVDESRAFRRFAITTSTTRGHLWELVSGVWTNRAIRTSKQTNGTGRMNDGGHGTPGITGDSNNPEASLFDYTYYPNGDFMVFTNFLDTVQRFPAIGAGTSVYEAFNQNVMNAGNSTSTAGLNSGGSFSFLARTCETFAERICFMNTKEFSAPTLFPTRVRWTNINSEPTLNEGAIGAGFLDIDDVESHGLKLLQLGDVLAAYMDEGTAILRRTRNVSQALTLQSVTEGRGLLSTHSVVDLGSGVHFGLFTDGWFFYDSTGRWVEAGVRDVRGKINHKFKETFLEGDDGLNWDNRDRVVIALDRSNRFVRISFPIGPTESGSDTNITPNRIWVYDIQQDSVWPMGYGNIKANMYGSMADVSATTTYATIDATIDSYGAATDADTYASFGFRTGRSRPVFGTTTGQVFRHSAEFTHREQLTSTAATQVFTEPGFNYDSPEQDFGIPSSLKRTDKLHLTFERVPINDPIDLQVTFKSGGHTVAGTVSQAIDNRAGSAATGKLLTNYTTGRVSGHRIGFNITGTAPAKMHSFQLDYFNFGVQGTRD